MRLHASFFTILICVAPAVGLTDGAFPNDQLSTRLFARNDAPVDAADVFSNVAVFYYVKPADGNIISDALNRDAIPYTKRHYIRPEHERALSNALICGPDTPVQAIKKVALALINAGVDLKYIGTKGDARPRQVSILSLFRKSYTINYVNITREQVIALSECPSELKNKAAPKAVEATAPSSPSTTAQIISPTPATSSTLEKLQQMKRFWEEQVFYCKVGPLVYPSKNDNVYDPSQRYDPKIPKAVWEKNYISESASDCDDGDMVFFSSMLCAAGDNRGCTMVASSQDKSSGRWWRSKRRIGESDTSDHASFSTEQGLGVYNYMVKKADKSAFSNWLEWIDLSDFDQSPAGVSPRNARAGC